MLLIFPFKIVTNRIQILETENRKSTNAASSKRGVANDAAPTPGFAPDNMEALTQVRNRVIYILPNLSF